MHFHLNFFTVCETFFLFFFFFFLGGGGSERFPTLIYCSSMVKTADADWQIREELTMRTECSRSASISDPDQDGVANRNRGICYKEMGFYSGSFHWQFSLRSVYTVFRPSPLTQDLCNVWGTGTTSPRSSVQIPVSYTHLTLPTTAEV